MKNASWLYRYRNTSLDHLMDKQKMVFKTVWKLQNSLLKRNKDTTLKLENDLPKQTSDISTWKITCFSEPDLHQYRRTKSRFRNLITLSSTTKLLRGLKTRRGVCRHPNRRAFPWRLLDLRPFRTNRGSVFKDMLLILLFEFRLWVVFWVVFIISQMKV